MISFPATHSHLTVHKHTHTSIKNPYHSLCSYYRNLHFYFYGCDNFYEVISISRATTSPGAMRGTPFWCGALEASPLLQKRGGSNGSLGGCDNEKRLRLNIFPDISEWEGCDFLLTIFLNDPFGRDINRGTFSALLMAGEL